MLEEYRNIEYRLAARLGMYTQPLCLSGTGSCSGGFKCLLLASSWILDSVSYPECLSLHAVFSAIVRK